MSDVPSQKDFYFSKINLLGLLTTAVGTATYLTNDAWVGEHPQSVKWLLLFVGVTNIVIRTFLSPNTITPVSNTLSKFK